MKIKINVEDLTLRGQLTKMKDGFGDDISWISLNDKQLKEEFIKTLTYYTENEKKLGKKEKEYLRQLRKIQKIVYGE